MTSPKHISEQIELVPISTIKENPDNPRTINEQKFKELVQSIKEFPEMLQVRPIILGKGRMVLGGNMRLRACHEAGLEQVWVLDASSLSPAKQKEFVIKDNLSYGEWNWDSLANEWDMEDLSRWGMDIPSMAPEPKEAKEDHFELPDPDEYKTDIKMGDVFQIGEHRLMCGDSTNQDHVLKLMRKDRADLIFTDPPYGVSYTGVDNDGNGSKWEMIQNDNLRGDDLALFLVHAFRNMHAFSKDNVGAYIWHASATHTQFELSLIEAGFEVRQQLIWNKGMTLGRAHYHWAHEPLLYCSKKGQSANWNGDRTQKTILQARRTDLKALKKEELVDIIADLMKSNTCWEIDREKVVVYQHPTQKPVTLAGRAMENSSKEGDIVLDLFGGSGSTMVGAHQMDRKAYIMEISPKFCQVIIDRMRALSPSIEIKKNGRLLQES